MAISHVVYGLGIQSNVPVPGLPFLKSHAPQDVRLRLKQNPAFPTISDLEYFYASSNDDALEEPALRVAKFGKGRYFGLFYRDGARFAIERDGGEVWADWPDGYSLEDACTYLLGPVLAFVLRLRGVTCLHASAVAIGEHAIGLMGRSEAGKSTTAAAFAKSGYAVLSDDVVALVDKRTNFLVQPGYPRVNLWPDSVRALFGSEEALPTITPTWDKRFLALGQGDFRFQSRPLPLRAIYVLNPREPDASTCPIEPILPSAAMTMMTLVANTYVNYLLDDEMRRRDFDVLGRLLAAVPLRAVQAPDDPSLLGEVCEAIAADARALPAIHSNAAAPGRLLICTV